MAVTLPPNFTLLQVVPELETGGAEQTTIDVANAVVRVGGKALVATRGGRMTARLEADGGRLAQMPVQSKNPLVMLGNAARLVDLIRKENVSLVHARSRAPAFSALWAAQVTGTPFVATYHGIYNAKTKLKRWYNAVMTRGDLVIANSDYTRDHVRREHDLPPEKIVTIPRGVDLDRFNPAWVTRERIEALREAWCVASDDNRVKILLGGRLTRIKGHPTIIAAAARMKAAGQSNFLIIFAGDDQGRTDYREELEASIRDQGLSAEIKLVGHCDDMPAACLVCDLAILPTTVPESFGRTAVEPQAMGRPVIASSHGGATETVLDGKSGWLVAPGDAPAWAAAMTHAIELGPVELRKMGELAQTRARQLYSAEAMCAATMEAYERVLTARAHGA
ncbi:glycosyltransferase family 4 protein [Phenylobacterium sp. 20VBR1]|uniref:Glycosyltransferase family 4 protein n=1 Tax=Phenylobacterium glaciei TaxID=2803784 RepID=A0A941HYE2_9CAUL|nr:glycosyltransferase family 4 protein [Phenylobacterium glaciei]MBR7621345.1 glycosyltransferase family 4 protein [Phenylobacterium glaciei]